MSILTTVRLADDLRWCPQCRIDRMIELVDLPDSESESVPVCQDCGCAIG
jgi:hypothetical protein